MEMHHPRRDRMVKDQHARAPKTRYDGPSQHQPNEVDCSRFHGDRVERCPATEIDVRRLKKNAVPTVRSQSYGPFPGNAVPHSRGFICVGMHETVSGGNGSEYRDEKKHRACSEAQASILDPRVERFSR